ncbi:MAG TPA: DMT family transporter, partial [Candidatus Limnocylindrales bacterium]|nr:DMT family transporter [Candidatus Limnocylindrales bacterium]
MLHSSVDRITLLAFLFATLILGVNWVGVRFSNQELPPFWGASLRFFAASLILFAVVGLRGIALPRGRALTGALVYGALIFGASFALLYWAMVYVPAGTTSVVFATLPLITLFVSVAAGFERITGRAIVGAFIAMAGLAVIFGVQLTTDIPIERIIAIPLAGFVGSIGTIVVKSFPRTHVISTNAIGIGTGAVFLLAASFVAGEPRALPELTDTWVALAYLVASTTIGFSLVTYVILRWTPSASAYST